MILNCGTGVLIILSQHFVLNGNRTFCAELMLCCSVPIRLEAVDISAHLGHIIPKPVLLVGEWCVNFIASLMVCLRH